MPAPIPESLKELLKALDASPTALGRETGGLPDDWAIRGQNGHIYPDGAGWLLYLAPRSEKRWTNAKRAFGSRFKLTQDGDEEGCFHLDGLPDPEIAVQIRKYLKIRRRRPPPPHAFTARGV